MRDYRSRQHQEHAVEHPARLNEIYKPKLLFRLGQLKTITSQTADREWLFPFLSFMILLLGSHDFCVGVLSLLPSLAGLVGLGVLFFVPLLGSFSIYVSLVASSHPDYKLVHNPL